MRRAVKWAFSGLVLGLFLVVPVLLGGCSRPSGADNAPAMVNGSVIGPEVLELRERIVRLFDAGPSADNGTRAHLRDQMIQERLLLQQADRLGLTVTDEAVEAEMALFFGALERQHGTREAVNERLQEAGLTNEAVAAFLHDYLRTQAVAEWKRAEVMITEEHARSFYEQYKGTLYTFDQEAVRAAHVLIPVDQAEIAKEVAARAKAGGDFAELTRLYSVDPGTSRVGGDLGYFTRGTMASEVADAAFRLAAGEVGGPIRSQFGWHVLLVTDRQGPGTVSFEDAHADVLNRMLPDLQDAAFAQWMVELEKGAKVIRGSL